MAKSIEDHEAFEWAARELYEANKGVGSWTKATTPDRSKSRQIVRVILATLDKYGWTVQPKRR